MNFKLIFNSNMEGSFHGDDIPYIFRNNMSTGESPIAIDSKEFGLIKKMVAIVTSFIMTGNPNNDQLENLWEPFTDVSPIQCMNMTVESFEIKSLPEQERREGLDEIFNDANIPIY